ncbi:ganglioside GM2 activator-like [Mytilus trossulus]|uniref:ganglioside GM2 activator-like n=1 Tax=Mytilus trossulus TaxID=6551 RepID=UPI0030045491
MESFSAVLFLALIACGFAAHTFKWTDCSVASTRILTLTNFDLSPKPVKLPGNITVDLVGTLSRRLPANTHYKLNVTMDKKLLGHWHAVPCNKKVGTCLYDDPCEFLQTFSHNNTCPQSFIDNGLTCTCPFDPVKLNVQQAVVTVKSIPSQWGFLATGDFRARVEVLEGSNMIGCFTAELSIATPCTGFLCGRK